MPKPTKHDLAIASFLGGKLSAQTLRRLTTTEGLGLPSGAAWSEYGPALASLTGRGRDLDVAAIRLAAEHGFPTARLRQVLAQPADDSRAAVVLEALQAITTKAASEVVDAGTLERSLGMPETPEQETANITKSTRYELGQLYDGDPDVLAVDSARITKQVSTTYSGPPEPGREDVYADEFTHWLRQAAEQLRSASTWLAKAADAELVAALKIATAMWTATVASRLPLGEEDSWRMIATLAPVAGVLVQFLAEVQSQIDTPPPSSGAPPARQADDL